MGAADGKGVAQTVAHLWAAAESGQPWDSGAAAGVGDSEPCAGDSDRAVGEGAGGISGEREMDKMEAEINRLRLSVKLNSNALERLVRGASEPEGKDA